MYPHWRVFEMVNGLINELFQVSGDKKNVQNDWLYTVLYRYMSHENLNKILLKQILTLLQNPWKKEKYWCENIIVMDCDGEW